MYVINTKWPQRPKHLHWYLRMLRIMLHDSLIMWSQNNRTMRAKTQTPIDMQRPKRLLRSCSTHKPHIIQTQVNEHMYTYFLTHDAAFSAISCDRILCFICGVYMIWSKPRPPRVRVSFNHTSLSIIFLLLKLHISMTPPHSFGPILIGLEWIALEQHRYNSFAWTGFRFCIYGWSSW